MGPTASALPRRSRTRLIATAFWMGGAGWLAAVTAGFVSMFHYSAEPAAIATPPARWPTQAPLSLDPLRPTLVLFAHPHCPCTRATLAELDRVMARCVDRLAATVLFYKDPQLGPRWERTELWDHAASIPGVRPLADPLGETARVFGAMTSGLAVLYAPDGHLMFHGGITASRGHEGDNAGAEAIIDLVASGTGAFRTSEVYGCALVGPEPQEKAR